MVLVNDPGSLDHIYPQLKHAAWHGWTFTDWIFPFFLFIVGVSMTFSFDRRMEEGAERRLLVRHIVRRSVIIFALGLFVNGFPFWLNPDFSLSTFRIPGVLQRIAICYLLAGVIVLRTTARGQAGWIVGLLGLYWLMVKLIPVPGYGAGNLEPEGNLLWYVDSTILSGHTWVHAPAQGFDPEGTISTIPAIATTLIGFLTGHWIRSARMGEEKTVWMFVIGHVLLLLGLILDMWLPINKNMWTSSYVVFMGGWSLISLATFYWLIDVRGYIRWSKPFIILGRNAIALFVLAETVWTTLWVVSWTGSDGTAIALHDFLFDTIFAPLASPINASLFFAIGYVLLIFIVGWMLHRRNLFIRI
ncbi:MAG TPA: DUF5009 domain-containing protein [Bacteroidetes bacterium]|nr:DUF5009 domain-containing protein [Bacteroidota bacterium]